MDCLLFEYLALYIANGLDEVTTLKLQAHLDSPCLLCQEKLAWYKQTMVDLKTPLNKGPNQIVEKAKQLFARSSYIKATLPYKILTRLIFDSSVMTEKLSVRNLQVIPETTRRLVYKAEVDGSIKKPSNLTIDSFDIDIEIQSALPPNLFILQGQILFENEIVNTLSTLYIDLIKNGNRIQNTTTNSFGEFFLSNIAEGDYSIQIKSDSWVAIAELPIRI